MESKKEDLNKDSEAWLKVIDYLWSKKKLHIPVCADEINTDVDILI